MVGPKVGRDLRQKALQAIFFAFLFIALYISMRFEPKASAGLTMLLAMGVLIYLLTELNINAIVLIGGALAVTLALCWFLRLPYALGALLSLVHDILITVGIFALFNKEFTLEVFAALLTLSGYSLNDTIIVYDRIRENRNKDKRLPFADMINGAINQTLSRTVLTSMTVFFVILMLFVFGGTVIHDFCFAMLIGVITGSYSSVFVASPILVAYEELRTKKPASLASRRGEAPSLSAKNGGAGRTKPQDTKPARVSGLVSSEGEPPQQEPAAKPKRQKRPASRSAGARKSGA
jgi:preprotein translocase subunit SecF